MIPTDPPKKTILCIDDDASILRYEKALLERSGYEVLTASSAQQGLQLATTCRCDAVLLEYEMIGMKGHEVASEIKLAGPETVVHPARQTRSSDARVSFGGCFCAQT